MAVKVYPLHYSYTPQWPLTCTSIEISHGLFGLFGYLAVPALVLFIYIIYFLFIFQSIKQLAHALSTVKLKENSLIRILWPKEKCRLLREDVVLVDR